MAGDFEELVASAQESWATSGRLTQVDVTPTSADSTMDSANTVSAAEDCFYGFRDQDLNVWRHAGADRYETAVCISRAMWADHDDARPDVAKAQAVVLARGDRYEDAVSSGPLAAWVEAPLLLTSPGSLRAVVREETDRILAPGGLVYLIGGPNAISDEVEAELATAGYMTKRLAGSNRYTTAVAVAEELPSTSNFFFATGKNFPDALGAGTAAAALTVGARETGDYRPFALLLTRDDAMNQDVSAFVQERAQLFGGWTLVSAGGQAEKAAVDAFGANSLSASFSGADRYDTAAQVAEGIFAQSDSGELVGLGVGLATGTDFPDALAATPYLAEFAQPLLLARQTGPGIPTRDFLRAHSGEGGESDIDRWIDVFGGESAIDGSTLRAAVGFFQ
jgi:putative cell wall-binding protein